MLRDMLQFAMTDDAEEAAAKAQAATKRICSACDGDGYSTEPNLCGNCHGTGRVPNLSLSRESPG